ncbi:SRPBCC domain-containing protein [Streptomyces sp. NRRL S-87]|uniref:SRPBCC domain-containing protein n=1 Tax=Streptomyces sp. NRRL S-87 TaxID=1463920 RepID=UPI0004C27E5A|nr:SRPBCC domain-containing protein [Streptomyces sp. NRRL S-87]
MTASLSAIGRVASERRGADRFRLRFEVNLPHGYEPVWAALTTAEGLRGWLAAADELQRRIGGRVVLRWLDTGTTASGRITAWDVERVAEYTVTVHGRLRFHLEASGPESTVLRFTNERAGSDADRLDALAGWHAHFELLAEALQGRPADWERWTDERWRTLRAHYGQQ